MGGRNRSRDHHCRECERERQRDFRLRARTPRSSRRPAAESESESKTELGRDDLHFSDSEPPAWELEVIAWREELEAAEALADLRGRVVLEGLGQEFAFDEAE